MSESPAVSPCPPTATRPPRLLDQLNTAAVTPFGRPEPGQRLAGRAPGSILFYAERHPLEPVSGQGTGGQGRGDER